MNPVIKVWVRLVSDLIHFRFRLFKVYGRSGFGLGSSALQILHQLGPRFMLLWVILLVKLILKKPLSSSGLVRVKQVEVLCQAGWVQILGLLGFGSLRSRSIWVLFEFRVQIRWIESDSGCNDQQNLFM